MWPSACQAVHPHLLGLALKPFLAVPGDEIHLVPHTHFGLRDQ